MAHFVSSALEAVVGKEIWLPLGEDATGILIGDFTSVWLMLDGVLVADQAPYGIQLVEVDDVGAPGYYFVRITPQTAGTLHLHMVHTAHEFDYTLQVSREPDPLGDPTLEGEYTVTVDDGVDPVQGAVVRVFDAAGTKFITRGTTDALGDVTFTLPIGNYQVRAFKDGVDFDAINPTTITVTPTAEAAPLVYEVLPATGSIGDTIAIIGRLFDQTSQVRFGAEATVAADYVNPAGTVILVTVPALTGTIFALRVDKPDPANLPLGKLNSNSVTWVRV
jgi:hypothetical protein